MYPNSEHLDRASQSRPSLRQCWGRGEPGAERKSPQQQQQHSRAGMEGGWCRQYLQERIFRSHCSARVHFQDLIRQTRVGAIANPQVLFPERLLGARRFA